MIKGRESRGVKGVKKAYLTDRWTGQKWIKSTGVSEEGVLYDGAMTPYISKDKISAKGKEILPGPIGKERKRYLEKVSEGHAKYEKLYKQYEEEYNAKFIEPLLPPKERVYERALKELELLGDRGLDQADYIKSRIPENIKEDYEAWRKYDDLERKYWHQLHNIQSWADKEAEKTLKAEAYSTKKTATYLWFFLLGIVFVVAGVLAVSDRKRTSADVISN